MGGQAAINLIPKFKITDHDPRYIRATPDQATVTELLNIKSALILAKLIKNTESKFNLGSSRLFAVSAGLMNAEVFVNEIETVAIINNAVRFKPSFGDIDLDVEFEKEFDIKKLGYDIWVDTKSTCAHIGSKVWMGSFKEFLDYIKSEKEE